MGKKKREYQEKQCNLKCDICEHYKRRQDFCTAKELANCSKTMKVEFAKCDDFLIDSRLVYF